MKTFRKNIVNVFKQLVCSNTKFKIIITKNQNLKLCSYLLNASKNCTQIFSVHGV